VLERVRREIETVDAPCKGGELTPDVRHPGIVTHDLLQQADRRRPFALAGEIDGGAIDFEDLTLVFRVRQRFAWRSGNIRLRPDVAERLQAFARIGRPAS